MYVHYDNFTFGFTCVVFALISLYSRYYVSNSFCFGLQIMHFESDQYVGKPHVSKLDSGNYRVILEHNVCGLFFLALLVKCVRIGFFFIARQYPCFYLLL